MAGCEHDWTRLTCVDPRGEPWYIWRCESCREMKGRLIEDPDDTQRAYGDVRALMQEYEERNSWLVLEVK